MARARGIVHVDRMLRGLTSEQFFELMYADELDPPQETRIMYQLALIACMVVNVKSKKQFKVEDFILKFGKTDEPTIPKWKQIQMANRAALALTGNAIVEMPVKGSR